MVTKKSREEHARRAARRQGIAVAKVRRFDRRALDYDTWRLDDPHRNRQLEGLSLDQVEAYLDGELPAD